METSGGPGQTSEKFPTDSAKRVTFQVDDATRQEREAPNPFPKCRSNNLSKEGGRLWAKIDDNYFGNAKVLRLSGPARFLHLTSLIWAAGRSNGTGVLPKPVLPQLGVLAGIPAKALRMAANQLVEVGLWEDHGDDWLLHDFVPFTPPKKREENAGRLAEWRAAKDRRKTGERQVKDDSGLYERRSETRPVPVPVPVPDPTRASPNGDALLTLTPAGRLTTLLAEAITLNGSKPPNTHSWELEADRMLRLDGRPFDEAEGLIRWCQDDPFWKPNILSMAKFRQKYDTLRLQRDRGPVQAPTRTGQAIAAARDWASSAKDLRAAGL